MFKHSFIHAPHHIIHPSLKPMLPLILARTGIKIAKTVGAPPIVGAALGAALGGVILALNEVPNSSKTIH